MVSKTRQAVAAFFIITLCTVMSCKKEDVAYIKFDKPVEFTVGYGSGKTVMTIETNYPWTCQSDASWLTCTKSAGEAGTLNIGIKVTENSTGDSRTASVVFTSEETTVEVKVTQKQNPVLLKDQTSFDVPFEGGELEVKFSTNMEYDVTIKEGADWITKSGTRAVEEYVNVFNISKNETASTRRGVIVFTMSDGEAVTAYVRQGCRDDVLVVKHSAMSFASPLLYSSKGTETYGTIDWGDGITESWDSTVVHEYESEGTKTITLKATDAAGFTINDISGISAIDLSKFGDR